ncbi:MAG: glutamine synthetase [Deltaproteobacteria bacterium]|nr:glutamine synthetase [Deltaproteobacteria bacterium]
MPARDAKKAHENPARVRQIRGILRQCQSSKIQLVRFLYCGNDGVIRGKACHADYLEGYLESGIGLTVAMQSFNMLDQLTPGGRFGPVGEIRLVPDPATFAILPYAPRSARLLVDMVRLDQRPWEACARSFLKRMIQRAAERGSAIKGAFENEFTLARQEGSAFVPIDRSPCFSSIGMDSAAPVILDIVEALGKQGVSVEQYYAELGPGQQEMPVRYAPALRAADNQLTFRDTVRGVALTHGLYASFAPKPFPEAAGNGAHLHFSAWSLKEDRNLFYGPGDPHGLSKEGYHFIGGVLKHLRALVALTAPSVNSYRRLRPQSWSSAFVCYGPDNREAAVRIASPRWGREMESTNLELKPSDPSNNPYLALGGLIAAGLDGLEKGLDPGGPLLVDPATLSEPDRTARGLVRLPTSLEEALDELERDDLLCQALGEVLAGEYVAVKRSEVRGFKDKPVEFELEHHRYKY